MSQEYSVCQTCDDKGKNTRGQRCLDCNGSGKIDEEYRGPESPDEYNDGYVPDEEEAD